MAKSPTKAPAAKAGGAKDRDTAADHAAAKVKQATGRDVGTDNARARAAEAGEDQTGLKVAAKAHEPKSETITQRKQTVGEALGGADKSMESIGTGSITEEAPAIRAQEAVEEGAGKIVQQGADVILHSHNPVNGSTENRGRILKVNSDGSVAVRVDLGNGQTRDFTGVRPNRSEDTNPWFELAA